MKMNFWKKGCTLAAMMAITVGAQAKVVMNSLFNHHCVLQRNANVPVWGTANDGEKITVTFNGQTVSTVAQQGKWMVQLAPMKAGGPYEMVVKGDNTLTLTDVLVGEVWLCSGQSNMGFPLRSLRPIGNNATLASLLQEAQTLSQIRQFKVPLGKAIPQPLEDVKGKWTVCDSLTAKDFSAVAFFFIRDVYRHLKIPVAIINSSYGGTQCENWLDRALLETDADMQKIITNYEKALRDFPTKLEEYAAKEPALWVKFREDSANAVAQNKPLPRKPAAPTSPSERGGVGGLYNSMIKPLVPYAIKGVIWYQGEANSSRGKEYRKLFPLLIGNWRQQWNAPELPFFFVQIPGWKNHFPEMKEAQLLTWKKTPNTGMAVAFDADDTLDVHPGNKQPIGERLALIAKALVYKEKIEYSGPVYESFVATKDDAIELTFSHIGGGLVAKDGAELKDFTICGSDKVFVPAKAIIKGKKVLVFSELVKKPVAVRYGWRLCPQGNLYNVEGLPASPFRTDVD